MRKILDNILLAHELVRDHHRDENPVKRIVKVDILKVYDSVKWDFGPGVLSTIGCPTTFCGSEKLSSLNQKYFIHLQ